MCLQALAEQQKAQQLAQQQQAGTPQAQVAPGQAQTPAGQAQTAGVPQATAVASATTVPNAAVLVRIQTYQYDSIVRFKQKTQSVDFHSKKSLANKALYFFRLEL